MRSVLVVIRHQLRQHGREVLLAQNDDVVEALSPEGAETRSTVSFDLGAWIGVAMASIPMRRACGPESRP